MTVPNWLARIGQEPLVWFLVLGTLVFVVDRAVSKDAHYEIVIDQSTSARLSASWQTSYGRPPNRQEMISLIDDHLVEEMLYREALELGLDQDDQIIRRRLAQKTQFLHEDAKLLVEADATSLREWFEDRRAAYERPARLSFRHVFINPEQHGSTLQVRLDELAESLRRNPESSQGDLFLLPSAFSQITLVQVANQFGGTFATEIDALPLGAWAGPIKSSYGLHFVLLEGRSPASIPSFEELLPKLRLDYAEELRNQANQSYIASLREKYRVVLREDVVPAEASNP